MVTAPTRFLTAGTVVSNTAGDTYYGTGPEITWVGEAPDTAPIHNDDVYEFVAGCEAEAARLRQIARVRYANLQLALRRRPLTDAEADALENLARTLGDKS